ncbi:MAG TPA: STAS domain-containing protein [Terracidiphilus sp.]|nr:STAS domain-containing protein [Terracidiphilus sp.]
MMDGTIHSYSFPESPNRVVPEGVTSLVRGAESHLLEQIMPIVRHRSVWLDLGCVERIDAAGIAALITLYRAARDAGRCFGVTNPNPHVREILRLVGLDRFLMNESSAEAGCPEPDMAQSAA